MSFDDRRMLALGPCYGCGTLFEFDPETVDSIPVDPATNLPPTCAAAARVPCVCSGRLSSLCARSVWRGGARSGVRPVADRQEVVYRGYQVDGGGPSPVLVYDSTGAQVGVLALSGRHSPTGFAWGYAGSGPAELARSLLLAALDDPRCLSCAGGRQVIYDIDSGLSRPYRPGRDPAELAIGCGDCEDGCRRVPYQRFKREFVAGWGRRWSISRSRLRRWLRDNGVEV